MGNLLHVCLYNADPDSAQELKSAIQSLNFVRLAAEVSSPDALAAALTQATVNLVFFHLDPDVAAVVDVIDQVSTRYPGLALIAISHETGPEAILAPMRAGCDQFVCEPIDPADLATAVGRVASKRLLNQPKSRCICFTGASGGAGATSLACNLALEIANLTDKECALVDLDLQFGDVAINFDSDPKYTLYDLATAGTDLDHTILMSTLTKLPCKVALLPRPELIEQHEAVTPDAIHRVIELLTGNYENVIIDLPRHMDPCAAAALTHADLVLIVCQLLVPSVRNAKRYFNALTQMGIPEERLQIVVNRGDSRTGGRLTTKDIEDTSKKPVYACIPNDYQFVARSIDFGRPIAALDRNSPVRAAIRKMARQITASSGSEKREKGEHRGFLSRLLAK